MPEYFDYGYGLYKLVGLAGVIPFIRGAVIPPEMPFTQSSDVLVMILLGPSATWGVGTNVIADIYMDFGLFGVPILLFLVGLGVAYTRVSLINHPDSPWRAVFYLVTLALVAELPRYSLTFPVRPLVWVFLLFWAVAVLTPAIRQQHPSRGHHSAVQLNSGTKHRYEHQLPVETTEP
ncbi:O-antigen polysaccharide polymerase Wzy [Mycolicibacterium vaccae]|nr:O-antigen polysaccharide polymerase Wzy [Mycolicibacterium vaccae]